MNEEYVSLRDEVMKWQDRRIAISQIAMTLVVAYTGYMVSKDSNEISLSWQVVSILPLSILSVTMHITRLFDLFTLKAAAYIAVFYESAWEKHTTRISFSNGILKIGYNKSMAIIYFIIAFSSIVVFFQRFPNSFFSKETILFIVFVILFLFLFFTLFAFNTKKEKGDLIKEWTDIKSERQ